MIETLQQLVRDPIVWKYVSIPFVAAVVGWATNWVAVKMTFYPLEFKGLRPIFGWQGIIPSKAAKMAATFTDTTMSRLGTFPEVFAQMEPARIAEHIKSHIRPRMDEYTDDVMLAHHAVLWENLPLIVREQIYERARRSVSPLVDRLMADIGDNVEDLIDFKHLIVDRLVGDKALLNRLFLESGDREFRFIVRSGLYFGFLFGLVQLAVWIVYPAWWVLPVFGLLVGWATNWIALNLIFRPLNPRKIGPWTVQGLFLRRQAEVARVWCALVTREILTLQRIVISMLHGPRSDRSRALIRRHMKPLVDESAGMIKTAAQVAVGVRGFADLKDTVGDKAVNVSIDPFDDPIFNEDRAEVVQTLLVDRMVSLPSDQFQDLLRPCFQEDEWKLVLLGAALGLAAGIAQLIFVFGGL